MTTNTYKLIALLLAIATKCLAGDNFITEHFVLIKSNGEYTFVANSSNSIGEGETVAIPKEYYMAKCAVTCREWKAFIDANNIQAPKYWTDGNYPEGKADHPVLWVSADEALAYCEWLMENNPKYKFRLPSEAEWEYAAIGNQRTDYPWGNDAGSTYDGKTLVSHFSYNGVYAAHLLENPDMMVTYNNQKSARYGESEPVGNVISISSNGSVKGWIDHSTYTGLVYTDVYTAENATGGYTCKVNDYAEGASPFGCYNMSGNCWEWTTTVAEAVNGAEKGQMVNVVRGGSWYATSRSCRATFRGEGRKASGRYATIGIRLVAEMNDAAGVSAPSTEYREKVRNRYRFDGRKAKDGRGREVLKKGKKPVAFVM